MSPVITLYGVAVLFTSLALAIAMGPRYVIWSGVRALGYREVTEFLEGAPSISSG